jgi:hypothetical protein
MRFLHPFPLFRCHGVPNPITMRVSRIFRVSQTTPACDTEKVKLSYSHAGLGHCDTLNGARREKEIDRPSPRVIETRRINANTYHLTIDGQLWSEIEWSSSRRRWCIQDAAGRCLTHVESIVGQDRDVQTAIRLAKRMIIDGRMPAPEHARAQREERLRRDRLGEPFVFEQPNVEQETIPSVTRSEIKSMKRRLNH